VAEIPIQEKTHRRNLLPLILGALALLLILGWFMRRGRDHDATNRTDTAGVVAPAPTDTALATPAPVAPTDTARLDTTKAGTRKRP